MRLLTVLILLFCGNILNAQDAYTISIEQYRSQQKESFLKNTFGPLRKNQVDSLRYFSIDPEYKVTAAVKILFGEQKFRMPTYDGTSTEYIRFAELAFQLRGEQYVLTAYKNIPLLQNPTYQNYLFVPFMDDSNGSETYEGGRYVELDANDIKNGQITIDFNKAYNPYCAYSNGYRCPIPPFENHLKTTIFAGEQKYKGSKNERPVNKNTVEKFSQTEQEIIHSADPSTPLHVYQTTNEQELTVLKNVSKDIDPTDPLLSVLAQRMLVTVQDPTHVGVGIAAPQVGINKNMIWVQRFDKAGEPFELFINPKITWRSKLMRNGVEGCLSIPEQRGDVERSYAIRLQYWTANGGIREENIEGFTAVIFQHEVDHLYGILFPDRLEEQEKKTLIPLSEQPVFSIEKGDTRP
jgi:peptide deformylase